MTRRYKLLQIDAWSDGDEGWFWNNWFTSGEYSEELRGPLTEESAKKYFKETLGADFRSFEIDDDQYNLVLVDRKTKMPRYAIEYGSES